MAVKSEGKCAVSACYDKTLKLWDLETGEALRTLHGHSASVDCVAVLPDGNLAISGSWDKTLKLWDLGTGRVLQTLIGHSGFVGSVAVVPGEMRAVSASWDKTLKLWDLETRRVLRTLNGHGGRVYCVALTPDGKLAVSASSDKTLNLWDLETGLVIAAFHCDAAALACTFVDHRRIVAGDEGGRLYFLAIEEGTTLYRKSTETHSGAAAIRSQNPEGRLRQEIAACLQQLGPFHPNTLLGKLGLAAMLDKVGRTSEAAKGRQEVAKNCFSLGGENLVAAREPIEQLISDLDPAKDESILLKLKNKLEELDKDSFGRKRRMQVEQFSGELGVANALEVLTRGEDATRDENSVRLSQTWAVPSAPHPSADGNRAQQANLGYQQEKRRWKALPWWKRIRTPEPKPPTGIYFESFTSRCVLFR